MRYAKYITKQDVFRIINYHAVCDVARAIAPTWTPLSFAVARNETGYLAPIRVSDHEKQIIEWLAKRLSEKKAAPCPKPT